MSGIQPDSEFIFDFPKEDISSHWQAVQDYGRRASVEINWDDDRGVLVVRGVSVDPRQIIDDMGSLLYSNNGKEGEFYWDQNWYCTIQLRSEAVRLLIIGEEGDSVVSLRRSRAVAADYLKKVFPEWMQLVLNQIYPVYIELFSEGAHCSREEFFQTLRIRGDVSFDPECNQYELYLSANPLIDTHLIHLFSIGGGQCNVELER